VLASAAAQGVDRLMVTGDLVGYYFAPLQVLKALEGWDWKSVIGNHEEMLKAARIDPQSLHQVETRYGTGLRIALEEIDASRLDGLCRMPRTLRQEIGGCRILLGHGAPWDTDQYVYPDASMDLLERCADPSCDLLVLGHTHYPMIRQLDHMTLVNPGSVGQPRNRVPGAHWAVIDTESRKVEMRCEAYDAGPVVVEARRRHPEIPYLAEVLVRT
jgi:putative phosphoesterase